MNGSVRSVDSLLGAGRDRGHNRSCLRLFRWAYGLAVLSLALPAFAQHTQVLTPRQVEKDAAGNITRSWGAITITIVEPPAVGTPVEGSGLRGPAGLVATTTLTTDAGFGELVIPCNTVGEPGSGIGTGEFGCYESRYSIQDTCKSSAAAGQGCVHSVPQSGGTGGAVDGCVEQIACSVGDRVGRACAAANGVHITLARPYLIDNPWGAGHKGSPGDAACNHIINVDLRLYNRVYNYCQRRWESLDCAWCPRSAYRGSCNRFCDGLVITCTRDVSCQNSGCRQPDGNPGDEGWLDKNGNVKCLSSSAETRPDQRCEPDFAPDGDKDGDGKFDEGDEVEAKIVFDPDCSKEDLEADFTKCISFECPSGSSATYSGVSVPGALVRPRCRITDACEFNQDISGIDGNCGCARGGAWAGDECDEGGECPAGRENVNGICQCPQGQVEVNGSCTPIDLTGVSPFRAQLGCALNEESAKWVVDRFGNTIGTALTGFYNSTYSPACSFLVNNVAFFGAGALRSRLEAYGPGTCPAINLGNWRVGGEVLVQSGPGGTWHRVNERKAYNVGGTGYICDWLNKQRELVGNVMVFVFNVLALAAIIGRRAF